MTPREIDSIVRDVEARLRARENGIHFKTDRRNVCFSPARILYIPVVARDPSGRNGQIIMDIFGAVEQESEARFNVDVLVLPAMERRRRRG